MPTKSLMSCSDEKRMVMKTSKNRDCTFCEKIGTIEAENSIRHIAQKSNALFVQYSEVIKKDFWTYL